MPKDAKGNPRSGRGRAKYADDAHEDEKKEDKKDEKMLNGGGSVKDTPAKGADKKMGDSEDKAAMRSDGEGGDEDDGDIADVTEMHGPANRVEMDMNHSAGKHVVTSMHGEKRHKKTYTDPAMAIRHAHVAAGMGEPQMPQPQDPNAGGGGGLMSTEEMMRGMGAGNPGL